MLKEGKENVDTTTKLSKRSVNYEMAKLWFANFSKFADSMPNSDVKCLPSCLTKLTVHHLYVDQMKDQPKLSRTCFIYNMWKIHFPNVYIPKVLFLHKYCLPPNVYELRVKNKYGLTYRIEIQALVACSP